MTDREQSIEEVPIPFKDLFFSSDIVARKDKVYTPYTGT
jgi:hypothetical protein